MGSHLPTLYMRTGLVIEEHPISSRSLHKGKVADPWNPFPLVLMEG